MADSTDNNISYTEKDNITDTIYDVVKPRYSRLVFMVIDALRADFVLGADGGGLHGSNNANTLKDEEIHIGRETKPSLDHKANMPFTNSLIDSGEALAYISVAHTPTGTLL